MGASGTDPSVTYDDFEMDDENEDPTVNDEDIFEVNSITQDSNEEGIENTIKVDTEENDEASTGIYNTIKVDIEENDEASTAVLEKEDLVTNDEAQEFSCKKCPYVSTLKYNLKKHVMRVHDKIKVHKCETCEFTGCSRAELRQHIRRSHLDYVGVKKSIHAMDFDT